jgi:hypothetical protein
MAPSGIGNVMKAQRLATHGLTAGNGDVVVPPEQLQGMPAFYTALGVRPRVLVNVGDRRSVDYQTKQYYSDQTTRLKGEYAAAVKNKDAAGMRDARAEFERVQKNRKKEGLARQPMAELLRAPFDQRKRQRGIIGGVETTRANRAMALNMLYADDPEEAREIM